VGLEPLPDQDLEDALGALGDHLGGDGALEVLGQQRALRHEDVVVVARPLEQPQGPVLPAVHGKRDGAQRHLGRQPHEVVLAGDVVVQRRHRDLEVLGHGLEGETLETDVVRGLGDHVPADARRPADASSSGLHALRNGLGHGQHRRAPQWARVGTTGG
jgi:hypothetical protein